MPYDAGDLIPDSSSAAPPRRMRLLTLWMLWRIRQRERREASYWTDRDLRDVGLTRGDLWRELRRPLQPPR